MNRFRFVAGGPATPFVLFIIIVSLNCPSPAYTRTRSMYFLCYVNFSKHLQCDNLNLACLVSPSPLIPDNVTYLGVQNPLLSLSPRNSKLVHVIILGIC